MSARLRRLVALAGGLVLVGSLSFLSPGSPASAAGAPVVTTEGTMTFTLSANPPVSGQPFTITGTGCAGATGVQFTLTQEFSAIAHIFPATSFDGGTGAFSVTFDDWASLPTDWYTFGGQCLNVPGEALLDEFIPHGATPIPLTLDPTPPALGQDLTVSGGSCTGELPNWYVEIATEGDWWVDGYLADQNAPADETNGPGTWEHTFPSLTDPDPSTTAGTPFVVAACRDEGLQDNPVVVLYEVVRHRPGGTTTTTTTTVPGSTSTSTPTTAPAAPAAEAVRSNATFTG